MPKLLILALLVSSLAAAQETRQAVVHHAANPADETRPNNPQAPDVVALDAHLQRIVVLRFKYDTDLLAGLRRMVAQQKIRNAVILSGAGSVRNYQVHQVGNRDLPPKDVFVRNPTAPADIIGMSGFIMDGRIHPHITLANQDKAFGGHLEPGTTVFTFAIVTLGVLDDNLDLSKLDDWSNR